MNLLGIHGKMGKVRSYLWKLCEWANFYSKILILTLCICMIMNFAIL